MNNTTDAAPMSAEEILELRRVSVEREAFVWKSGRSTLEEMARLTECETVPREAFLAASCPRLLATLDATNTGAAEADARLQRWDELFTSCEQEFGRALNDRNKPLAIMASICLQSIALHDATARAETAEKCVTELEAATRWISVDEALPLAEVDVLVCTERGAVWVACIFRSAGWMRDNYFLTVTHWRPLPTAPQKEKLSA